MKLNKNLKKSILKFAELNIMNWNDKKNVFDNTNRKILVNVGQPYPVPIIECMMTAKKIAENDRVIDVVNYDDNLEYKKLYESWGINTYYSICHNLFNFDTAVRFFLKIKNIIKAIVFFFQVNDAYRLLEYKIDNINIGMALYDYIIRMHPKVYTIDRMRVKYIKEVYHFLLEADLAKEFMRSGKYDVYICMDADYQRSLWILYALKYNVKVYQCFCGMTFIHEKTNKTVIKPYQIMKEMCEYNKKKYSSKFINQMIDEYFQGDTGSLDCTAFCNKRMYSEVELYNELGIKEKKKNVLVAAHAFSDSPHYGTDMIYKDYFEWLIETLKILAKNRNVNVFVKEHPTAVLYGEKGTIKYYKEKYGFDNIWVIPNDFNIYSAYSIMDYFVTCQGTIGIECTIFGKPVVTAGGGYYKGFGIDIQAKSKMEYEDILKNITDIRKPTEDISEVAKEVLFASKFLKYVDTPEIYPQNRYRGDEKITDIQYQFDDINDKLESGIKMRTYFYETILKDRCIVLHD